MLNEGRERVAAVLHREPYVESGGSTPFRLRDSVGVSIAPLTAGLRVSAD